MLNKLLTNNLMWYEKLNNTKMESIGKRATLKCNMHLKKIIKIRVDETKGKTKLMEVTPKFLIGSTI